MRRRWPLVTLSPWTAQWLPLACVVLSCLYSRTQMNVWLQQSGHASMHCWVFATVIASVDTAREGCQCMVVLFWRCVNALEREVHHWPVGLGVTCRTCKGIVPWCVVMLLRARTSACNENKSNAMRVTVRILIYLSANFLPNLTSLLRGFSLCPGPSENP